MQEVDWIMSKLSFSQPSQPLLLFKGPYSQSAIEILWATRSLSGPFATNSPAVFLYWPARIAEAAAGSSPFDPFHWPPTEPLLLARVQVGCFPRRPSYQSLWLLSLHGPGAPVWLKKLVLPSFHQRSQKLSCEEEHLEGGDWEKPDGVASQCVQARLIWRAHHSGVWRHPR